MKFQKIKKIINKPKRIINYLRNRYAPITAENPNNPKFTYSDFFVWRNDKDINTFFDLTPYIDLIVGNSSQSKKSFRDIKLMIFTKKGDLFFENIFSIKSSKKQCLNLSELISSNEKNIEYGSFLIFHRDIPPQIYMNNGYLAERGYVSYSNKDSEIKSYMHGNLDAISSDFKSNGIKSFKYTKSTILNRKYFLQYLFNKEYIYNISLNNPSFKLKKITINFLNKNGNFIEKKVLQIPSLGTEMIYLPKYKFDFYISLESKLPMLRPNIFKFKSNKLLDVFHG